MRFRRTHHFGGVDDSGVVSELKHAQNSGQNSITQEKRQSLENDTIAIKIPYDTK